MEENNFIAPFCLGGGTLTTYFGCERVGAENMNFYKLEGE